MLYRVHFATEPAEPFPPLDTLPEIDADDPLTAVRVLCAAGRVPQDRPINWALVIVSVHDNGQPRQVIRVPITPELKVSLDWT